MATKEVSIRELGTVPTLTGDKDAYLLASIVQGSGAEEKWNTKNISYKNLSTDIKD